MGRQARAVVVLVAATWLLGGAAALGSSALYDPPRCATQSFHSAPALHPQRACMNLGVRSSGQRPASDLFITPDGAGAGIFTPSGGLVWWQAPPYRGFEHDARVVTLWGHRYLAVWSGGPSLLSGSVGEVILYNEHYRRVGVITAGAPYQADGIDLHEFRTTPGGDALVGVDHLVQMTLDGHSVTVVDYVVQKLSLLRGPGGIHTGRVLFQWGSLQHVPISQSHYAPPSGGVFDYFHGNAIAQAPDGNLLVSARNTWGIYSISEQTGHILWQVGAKGDHELKEPWCYQHDLTPLGANRFSLFDDGGDGPACAPGAGGHAARAIIFQVADQNHEPRPAVKLVQAYTHKPAIGSDWMGSVQKLPNGRILVDWGTTPEITEFSSSGHKVDLDLSLSFASYRAYSFPWVGIPLTPPSVAASRVSKGTAVWASWNGSTQVAAWRVLGGPSPSSLHPVSPVVAKHGFETRIVLTWHSPYVAVEALSKSGRTLRESPAIAPAR